MFFVLSGFSLSVKYVNEPSKNFDIFPYLMKRFFRLYPPLLIGLLVTLALRYYLFQPGTMFGLSEWINTKWLTLPSLKQIILFCLLLGTSISEINSTMWPIGIIIVTSLLFPIIIISLRKINSKISIIIFLVLVYALTFNSSTFRFLPYFVLGGIVAKYYTNVLASLAIIINNKFHSLILFSIALLLFNIRFNAEIIWGYTFPEHGSLVDTLTALGCLIIVYYSISDNRLTFFLLNKHLNYIGKISYSFYILHFPILLTITSTIYPMSGNIYLSILISFFVTIIASSIFLQICRAAFSKNWDL